jgi:probable HAF family extracellular repeat protein
MRWLAACLGCLFAALSLSSATKAVTFDDGLVHVIDAANSFPFEPADVRDGPGSTPTTLQIVDGGEISTIAGLDSTVWDTSILQMSGGEIGKDVIFRDAAQGTFTGGTAERLVANQSSRMEISGGILLAFQARDTSVVHISDGTFGRGNAYNAGIANISGGVFTDALAAHGSSIVTITGGQFTSLFAYETAQLNVAGGIWLGQFRFEGDSVVEISGGSLQDILALNQSTVTLRGHDFNLPYGEIVLTVGSLTGTLADGTPLNVNFSRASTATIRLVQGAAMFMGLGDLPGGPIWSVSTAVSADGSVVVGMGETASGSEAFRWTADGGMQGLGDLQGGSFNSQASDVSANGSVVVGHGSQDAGNEAFRWTSVGGMQGLGFLAGGDDSQGHGVSADGSVIVGVSRTSSGQGEAYLWTIGSGMVGLGDLPGGQFWSSAEEVSADGSTVVGVGTSNLGNEAFLWTASGEMVGLGDLQGGDFLSLALGVSSDGSTVVGFSDSTSGNEAFRWSAEGGMVGLGDLPGGSFASLAQDASDDGSVIVGEGNSDAGKKAIIWDSVHGLRELEQVLSDLGLDLGGWSLQNATDVSDDGLTIVGLGKNPSGDTEAWIAVLSQIPNPLTVSGSLVIHDLANDQVAGTPFPFDQKIHLARPLGARCNPGNGGATCGTTTLQEGAPLTGSVSLIPGTAISPPSFTLPQSALGATVTGSLPQYSPYQYISTHASNARNRSGFFRPGAGAGSLTFTIPGTAGPGARVGIVRGANQFGGTMRLLGSLGAKRAHLYRAKTFAGTGYTSFPLLGGGCTGTVCPPVIGTVTTTQLQYKTGMGKATTAAITAWGFLWTTGAVTITATAGPFPTLFRREGYDNRTPYGAGTIQLVTPQLAKWNFPDRAAPWDRHAGAIGILKLTFFVPEPSRWLLLAAGLGCLVALWRVRGRRDDSGASRLRKEAS